MNVWFPDYFTEAHRRPEHGHALAQALRDEGVHCRPHPFPGMDLIFCGSIWRTYHVEPYAESLPIVHYNWDLYPFQIASRNRRVWLEYIEHLKRCARILVPSRCTTERTWEFTDRESHVVLAPVRPFGEGVDVATPGSYVVDVMRPYEDPNRGWVSAACRHLGIPCVETRTSLPWDEFVKTIAGCRFVVSAYYEASTGGLTLLEGRQLGKPCLLSNSPRNGAVDYFGDRGRYFQWDSFDDLKQKISFLWRSTPKLDAVEERDWVLNNYGDRAFAKNLAEHFKNVLDGTRATGSAVSQGA